VADLSLNRPKEPSVNDKKKVWVPLGDRLQQEIRVYPGYGIIENNSQSSLHLPVDKFGWRWLYYIQNPEKKESPDDRCERAGQEDHSDQITHDFIDDDSWAIPPPQNDSCPIRCPPGQKKDSH
jgi:hypothetical protein